MRNDVEAAKMSWLEASDVATPEMIDPRPGIGSPEDERSRAGPRSAGSSPSLLVIGSDANARARAMAAAATVGLTATASVDVAGGLARLDEGRLADCIFVEIGVAAVDADGLAELEALLIRLHEGASSGRLRGIISTGLDLVDLVAARAEHPRIEQLAGASDAERAVALACVARPAAFRFRETSGPAAQAPQLRALAEDIDRISGTLARLAAEAMLAPPRAPQRPGPSSAEAPAEMSNGAQVRAIIGRRRLRNRYFDPELFADPAWDMLLDLMGAHLEAKRVAVSSLCIAAVVPPTTALRWIRMLTEAGLFVRRADPTDGRRVFIELSEAAIKGMRGYLEAAARLES